MAITITPINKRKLFDPDTGEWIGTLVYVEAKDNGNAYAFSGVVPVGNLIQTFLDNNKAAIFSLAQASNQTIDVMAAVDTKDIAVAVVEVFTIEINTLRAVAGLTTYTGAQVRQKLRDRLVSHLGD